jgi:hypothetical protein
VPRDPSSGNKPSVASVRFAVIVPMVKVGIVRVPLSQRHMLVPVRMRLINRHFGRMAVVVMIVMAMPVFVFHRLVNMFVIVSL